MKHSNYQKRSNFKKVLTLRASSTEVYDFEDIDYESAMSYSVFIDC